MNHRLAPNIDQTPHAKPGVFAGADEPLKKYPDEPHPDDGHKWKSWWIKKCYNPEDPLTKGDLIWIHQCWVTTMSRWCL